MKELVIGLDFIVFALAAFTLFSLSMCKDNNATFLEGQPPEMIKICLGIYGAVTAIMWMNIGYIGMH